MLLAVALWRARTVPGWLTIAFALTNLAGAVAPFGVVAIVVNVAFTLTLFGIAWYLWKRASRPAAAAVPIA